MILEIEVTNINGNFFANAISEELYGLMVCHEDLTTVFNESKRQAKILLEKNQGFSEDELKNVHYIFNLMTQKC